MNKTIFNKYIIRYRMLWTPCDEYHTWSDFKRSCYEWAADNWHIESDGPAYTFLDSVINEMAFKLEEFCKVPRGIIPDYEHITSIVASYMKKGSDELIEIRRYRNNTFCVCFNAYTSPASVIAPTYDTAERMVYRFRPGAYRLG